MMDARKRQHLRWARHVQVSSPAGASPASSHLAAPSARERLVAALAARPQTVAQLAQAFGLAQPTVLEQVRRALRDGLIVEVPVAPEERRFAAERYYAPAVPVIRAPDRELIESACRALAGDIAQALAAHRADLEAAFAMTSLAREGWSYTDLGPYLSDTIVRLVGRRGGVSPPREAPPPHGLAWVEEDDDFALDIDGGAVARDEGREASA